MANSESQTEPKADFLSVVVAAEPMQELTSTLRDARADLDTLNMDYEVICITDGRDGTVTASLDALASVWPELVTLHQRPWAGDDAALAVALKRARGSIVMTMAGWPEIAPSEIARLTASLGNADMTLAVRRRGSALGLQTWRRRRFSGFLARLFGWSPEDPFCRTRVARKSVLEDVAGFGVRQHFIPVIASQRGYRVSETRVSEASDQGAETEARYVFRPLGHLRAFFDALTLYVVLKFLRRPLRFFGSIGLPIFLIGSIATAVLVMQRLFGESLADRPALIFTVLMMVLGIQIIAIGLVGEIIVFSNSRRMKQYAVRDIIRQPGGSTCDTDTAPVSSPVHSVK